MATRAPGACMSCRARKVKCIPSTPRCIRCKELGVKDCTYVSVKKRGAGNTLRTGQACVPCRRKKARCDAMLPCTTCVNGDRSTECAYKSRQRSRPASVNVFSVSRDSKPGPLSARASPYQTSANRFTGPPINLSSSILPLTWSNSSESDSPISPSIAPHERPLKPTARRPWELSPCLHDEIVPNPSSDVSVVQNTYGTMECIPHLNGSSFTVLPSIHFQTIPRPLRVPLSFVPPEYVQVSSIAENDLAMSFRLRSLCRMNKLGIYFRAEKQEALLRGDTSNAVVDRYFVHGFQAVGMHLCEVPDASPAMVRLQARYCQWAWETLVDIYKTGDQKLKAQGVLLFVGALIAMGFAATAPFYLLKLCNIINEANLGFFPECGRPPELSEQVREDAAVLTQAIYLENYFYLTLDGSVPVMTKRIEKEFRSDLQVRTIQQFLVVGHEVDLAVWSSDVLLVKDAILILNSRSADDSEEIHHLVPALDSFSNALMKNLQRFIEIQDNSGIVTIWACCVICLAHLAALCHFVSQTEQVLRGSMDDMCDLALENLADLSREVHMDEYSHFDALTGISWKTALDTIDACIEARPHAESEPLQRWRGVIGKAYADFQANPRLGCGANQLVSLALSLDGRTGDSIYPNLLLPEERERYGL